MADVFFLPEYGRLYETAGDCECRSFVYTGEDGTVQHLYLMRPVPWKLDGVQYYDVVTPYGYGGPVLTRGTATPEFLRRYYGAWEEHCRENRIVAEFLRFHLFDNAPLRLAYPGQVGKVSDNVVRRLEPSLDEMWMEFAHKVRKNVKKAASAGLTVQTDADGRRLDDFLQIYYQTMERNHADSFYYFDRAYFQALVDTLPGHFQFFHVLSEDKVISTELVLCGQDYVYSFLGGTLEEYFPLRPNDLLKYEIIRWSRDTGHKAFVLGGGYGGNDGIYRYKKSFAPDADVPYYTGRWIHEPRVYEALTALRRNQGAMNEAYFPQYRG